MSFTVIIPARMASSRLPRKMVLDLAGQPLITHTLERALASAATRVLVATDHEEIGAVLLDYPCEVIQTRTDHVSGTDRLAEVVERCGIADNEIVVNVQGDEPLIPPRLINEVAASLQAVDDPNTVMATAASVLTDLDQINNPNAVKVVLNRSSNALYFSRFGIPYVRDQRHAQALHHIGIYAYRAGFLRRFSSLNAGALELSESLEQLRVLEHGFGIRVHTIDYDVGFGIDTEADLTRAASVMNSKTLVSP